MAALIADTVVCDMDGTLLASRDFALAAIRAAFAALKAEYPELATPPDAEIVRQIGKPFHSFYRDLLPPRHQHLESRLYALTQLGERRAIEQGEARLFPEVAQTLAVLKARGFRLALVSNCSLGYLESIDHGFGLSRYFERLGCVGQREGLTKPVLLGETLAALASRSAVMVGDRIHDREAARACGCAFVGCGYGYGDAAELEGSDALIAGFGELEGLLLAPHEVSSHA